MMADLTQHSQNGEGVEALPQPSDEATKLALTATPDTFPMDSYGLAIWLDKARQSLAREPATADVGREVDVAAEMLRFEAAYPCGDHAKHRNGEIVAGRVRYAEPEVDRMFSAWLSACATAPSSGRADEQTALGNLLWHTRDAHEAIKGLMEALSNAYHPAYAAGQKVLRAAGMGFPPLPTGTRPRFDCAAAKQGTAGGHDPASCDYPECGCDVAASSSGQSDKMLGELLAVIHRDGGQYQDHHGTEKAVADAMTLSAERLLSAPSSGHAMAEGEREAIARVVDPGAWHDHASFSRKAVEQENPTDANKWLDAAERAIAPSLKKSDAIIALRATTPPTTNDAIPAGMTPEGPLNQVIAGIIEDCLARHGVDLDQCEGTLDDAEDIIRALSAAPSAPATEAGEGVAASLHQALVLVDTMAGEGMIYHYDDGSTIAADIVSGELCAALGIEPDVGWPRVAADMIATPTDQVKDAGKGGGE